MEYIGEFGLHNSDQKFSGKVIVNKTEKKIELILYGNHAIDGTEIKDTFSSFYPKYHEVILGNTSFGYITLLYCNWIKTASIGKNIKEIVYIVDIVLSQVHISSIQDFKLINVLVRFSWLDSWIDGPESMAKVEKIQQGDTITNNIEVNENLNLIFIDNLRVSPAITTSTQKTKYRKYLNFSVKEPINFELFISYIFKFKRLLDFSIQRSNGIQLINIETDDKFLIKHKNSFDKDKLRRIAITNFSLEQEDFDNEPFKHQNKMLISGWKFSKDELKNIIKLWYSQKGLDHIHDFYLNTFTISKGMISNVTYNNSCLNLLQCLEEIHRMKYGNDKLDRTPFEKTKKEILKILNSQPVLKKWLNDNLNFTKSHSFKDRIMKLIEDANECIIGLIESSKVYDDYPQKAKEFRNDLSHANFISTYQGEKFNLVYALTKLLLTVLLMQSLKIENRSIIYSLKDSKFIYDLKWEIYLHL